MAQEKKITDLPALIEGLPSGDRAVVDRIFDVNATTGRLDPPESMHDWIESSFGSVDAVREQEIVKVTNLVTLEGSIFNGLRASRPSDTGTGLDLEKEIAETEGDPFCNPEEGTPADTFGRIEGNHSTTASNIAKYDGFHGVVVFDDHNPLHFTPEKVADYINVGLQWGRKAFEEDPEARYFFLMWNCLWRAGGSILHGHAQATATRNMHYPKVEHLRRAAARYTADHGTNYFDDLYRVHDALGLSFACPRRRPGLREPHARKRQRAGPVGRKHRRWGAPARGGGSPRNVRGKSWALAASTLLSIRRRSGRRMRTGPAFPCVVRLVDRGDPASRTSDMGAMELYAASVVAADPFQVAEALGS